MCITSDDIKKIKPWKEEFQALSCALPVRYFDGTPLTSRPLQKSG
jgi:hypothetical protein